MQGAIVTALGQQLGRESAQLAGRRTVLGTCTKRAAPGD